MKGYFTIILVVIGNILSAQEINIYRSLTGNNNLFKPVHMSLIADMFENSTRNGKETKVPYAFSLRNNYCDIKYCFSAPSKMNDTSCGYFLLYGNRIDLKGKFEKNFACDLDPSSFQLYSSTYNKRRYLLLKATNSGSGGYSSMLTINLFDITDPMKIQYFPLWSKYGGSFCLGDFDHSGTLKFLRAREYGNRNQLRISLLELKGKQFVPYNRYYADAKMNSSGSLIVVDKHWIK